MFARFVTLSHDLDGEEILTAFTDVILRMVVSGSGFVARSALTLQKPMPGKPNR